MTTNFTDVVFGKRILVAARSATSSLLLEELLLVDRHEITTCSSGMAALELLAKHEFDALLLDDNLVDMDGVRVLQTYRFGRQGGAPALFLTADESVQAASRIKDAGAAGILHPPFNLPQLRRALLELRLPVVAPSARPHSVPDVVKPASTSQPHTSPELGKDRPSLVAVPVILLDETVLEEVKAVTSLQFLASWLSVAERDITECCQKIDDALSAKNYAAVGSLAVKLKGASASVGAVRLAALAGTLMSMTSEMLDISRARLAADIRDSARATAEALIAESGTFSNS